VRGLILVVMLAGLVTGAIWLLIPRGPANPDRFLRHRGRLVGSTARDSVGAGGRILREIELEGAGGLHVRGRLSLPPGAGPFPAIILQGGLATGSRVITFIPEPGPMVWASLDYSYRMPRHAGFFTVLRQLPRMRRSAEQSVAGLWLCLDYLESLPEVDPARTLLLGGSLGAPLVAIAGALDARFEGVGLLYGGADLARVAEARLPFRSPIARSISRMLLRPWLDPVDPANFVPRISPRPVLLVNGREDTELPRQSVDRLRAAARDPKTLVWVDTPHKVQGNPALTEPVARAVWAWVAAEGWMEPRDIPVAPGPIGSPAGR
jgi:dienelactone hydrolase